MTDVMLGDNSVKYHITQNELYVRLGVWDYTEIFFDRNEFEKNKSNFDSFVSNFLKLLNGNIINTDVFVDNYAKDIIHKLKINNLLLAAINNKTSLSNVVIITEQSNFSLVEKYFKLIDVKYISFNILDLKEIKKHINMFKKSNVLVFSNPFSLKELENINNIFYKNVVTWTLGIIDYQFMHIMTFVPNVSACFMCFEKSNAIRMNNYENFIYYKNNEKSYSNAPISKNTSFQMLQYLINYGIDNSNSLVGKILSIYMPTSEFNIESLRKNAICPLEGTIAKNISETLNLDAISTIQKILNNKYRGE